MRCPAPERRGVPLAADRGLGRSRRDASARSTHPPDASRRARAARLITAFLVAPVALLALLAGESRGQVAPTAPPPSIEEELRLLRERVNALEGRLEVEDSAGRVDLSDNSILRLPPPAAEHPLALPWYQNVDVWGFGAMGFLDSGDLGTRPNGGFLVKEATVFVEARAWKNMSVFMEVQTNRLAKDDDLFVRTGEAHIHVRDLWKNDRGDSIGLKLGRVDIPFGEEYLSQDAPDNPLITQSAGYPYGFDEGLVLYGTHSGVGWVASLTDGTDARSEEDHESKAVALKVYGNPLDALYLSASFMDNGKAGKSAFEFGGSHFQPVGASHASTLGDSPSAMVNSKLWEVDAAVTLTESAEIDLSFGVAHVNDSDDRFDRHFSWFSVQPKYQISDDVYAVLRFSEIGTSDATDGYHFDGKILAGGNAAFGYDAQRLQRASAGLGWTPNPRALLKLEVGRDRFKLIDGSAFSTSGSDREFFGLEFVLSF